MTNLEATLNNEAKNEVADKILNGSYRANDYIVQVEVNIELVTELQDGF